MTGSKADKSQADNELLVYAGARRKGGRSAKDSAILEGIERLW